MPLWTQHLLALLFVIACASAVIYQSVQSLRGKKSKIGQCCAKGCAGQEQAAAAAKPAENRVHFMPVEMLSRRRPR